jgi:hypothetical protein
VERLRFPRPALAPLLLVHPSEGGLLGRGHGENGFRLLGLELAGVGVGFGCGPTSDATGELRKDLANDGLHPHWAGYEIMTRVLKEAAAARGLSL